MAKEKSILKKKQDELTVADNLKIGAGVTIVTMALSMAPLGVFYVVGKVQELRERKRFEDMNSDEE